LTIPVVRSALAHGLMPFAYYSLRIYLSTLRLKVVDEGEALKYLQPGGKGIAAVWHQRFLPVLLYSTKFRELKPCVMISQSRDGDMIAPVAERLGLHPVRGSGSRGGRTAMMAMVAALSENRAAAHIVDGPRGPKGVVKAGIVRLAQLSGAAIFPVYISTQKAWVTNSWDRSIIPKPFSRSLVRWGRPILVPREMDSDTFEGVRLDLERKLIEGHAQDDLNWGWKTPL